MTASDYFLTRFGKLSLFRQTCVVVLAWLTIAGKIHTGLHQPVYWDRRLFGA